MVLFPRKPQTAASIAAGLDQLRNEIEAEKTALKDAKEKRSVLTFDAPRDAVEGQNAAILKLETSIGGLNSRIVETERVHLATLADECVREQPLLWAAMQKQLLAMDDHARAIAAANSELAELEKKFRAMSATLQQCGRLPLALRRPLPVALNLYKSGMPVQSGHISVDEETRRAEVRDLNELRFTVGPRYTESAAAAIFTVLRGLTADDAKTSDPVARIASEPTPKKAVRERKIGEESPVYRGEFADTLNQLDG